jgi:hypothetical protein
MTDKITITFKNTGSADFDVVIDGTIISNQLLALAGWFEFQGKQMLADMHLAYRIKQEQEEENRRKIAVPGGVVLKQ